MVINPKCIPNNLVSQNKEIAERNKEAINGKINTKEVNNNREVILKTSYQLTPLVTGTLYAVQELTAAINEILNNINCDIICQLGKSLIKKHQTVSETIPEPIANGSPTSRSNVIYYMDNITRLMDRMPYSELVEFGIECLFALTDKDYIKMGIAAEYNLYRYGFGIELPVN